VQQYVRASSLKAESAGSAMATPVHDPAALRSASEIDHFSNTLKLMVAASKAAGFTLSADLRVGERDAAHLLGYSAGYLKTLRQEGKGPASYLRGLGGCRISYRLSDLVAWVESARDDR
jgi:hypothetical protein